MLFKSVDKWSGKFFIHYVSLSYYDQPEMSYKLLESQLHQYYIALLKVVVHSALNTVGLKSKVNVLVHSIVHVELVQHFIQAFIHICHVEQYYCSTCFHTNLDLVDISA